MKIISWNINGLGKAITDGMISYIAESNADIVCFQEIKTNKQIMLSDQFSKYYFNMNPSKAYPNQSGTAVLMKRCPYYCSNRLDGYSDDEGRTQIISIPGLAIINSYAPQSRTDLSCLDKKTEYMNCLRNHAYRLMNESPVLIVGDLNIYHECGRRDYAPTRRPGKSREESECLRNLLSIGLADIVDDNVDWEDIRQNTATTLQDHLLISKRLVTRDMKVSLARDIGGSDHFPLVLEINIPTPKRRR